MRKFDKYYTYAMKFTGKSFSSVNCGGKGRGDHGEGMAGCA
jgi:hypothetical protein